MSNIEAIYAQTKALAEHLEEYRASRDYSEFAFHHMLLAISAEYGMVAIAIQQESLQAKNG